MNNAIKILLIEPVLSSQILSCVNSITSNPTVVVVSPNTFVHFYLKLDLSYTCVSLGFLELLGAHQGEQLVQMSDFAILSSNKSSFSNNNPLWHGSTSNDRKIIEVALFWNAEIGQVGNVVLVTSDSGVEELAKRHGLPAAQWKEIEKGMREKGGDQDNWTAGKIRKTLKNCMEYGGRDLRKREVVTPVESMYEKWKKVMEIAERMEEGKGGEEEMSKMVKEWKGRGGIRGDNNVETSEKLKINPNPKPNPKPKPTKDLEKEKCWTSGG